MNDTEILAHLARDAKLAPALDPRDWVPRNGEPGVYGPLLRAVCGQQLSVAAARTIWSRFLHHFGEAVPPPADLLDTDPDTLRTLGLSRQKSAYLRHIASYFTTHPTALPHWESLDDETIVRELTTIKGVGVWTVRMLLMFALHRPDVLPVGDLGIQRGMQLLYGLDGKGKQLHRQMEAVAEAWRPYRSYACRSIWRWKGEQ